MKDKFKVNVVNSFLIILKTQMMKLAKTQPLNYSASLKELSKVYEKIENLKQYYKRGGQ
jgi:hypothetical protein